MLDLCNGRRNYLLSVLPESVTALSVPLLSIIIPAHNEESRLPQTLEQVFMFLGRQSYESEVLIIENGSTDHTFEIAQEYARRHKRLRVIREEGRGKGLAVHRGMFEARGEYRFMCDADLSMPVDEINKFLPPALGDFDVAIASREAHGAVRYNEPFYRHIGGRGINLIIRLLILPGLNDTQCGFKCFRADAAEKLFKRQTLFGWSFDIELLFLAKRHGYRVTEIPIHWYYRDESKVSALRDALRMIGDIFRIHLNAWRGRYDAHRS
ncbi:MAG: glycosyltransferase family 2 protein [Chloroflexi bacterium]|nr:glycosyltransferase family 2 protein [Chloroflexota bacterium]MBI3340203.1 glycosyltransferase family 2 protein [Chloroflexota bacterium]